MGCYAGIFQTSIYLHIYIYKDKADIHYICAFLLVTCNLRFRCTVLEVDAGNRKPDIITNLSGFFITRVLRGMLYHSYSKEP